MSRSRKSTKPKPFTISGPIGRYPTLDDTGKFYGLSDKQIADIRDWLVTNIKPKRKRCATS